MKRDLSKILDRVRKMLALAKNAGSEEEAAAAAARASALMDEYQLSEALVALDDPQRPKERMVKARLEPDEDECLSDSEPSPPDEAYRKRVAWKESLASALAMDLGVHMYYWNRSLCGKKRTDIRGFGRESAIQTWQYTFKYLVAVVEELADKAWEDVALKMPSGTRAWKNAFRVGCANRIAVRMHEKRAAEREARRVAVEFAEKEQRNIEAMAAEGLAPGDGVRQQLALAVVEKDRQEVDEAYKKVSEGWGRTSSIGSTSSSDGYRAGSRAGDGVNLGGKRAALGAG